MQQTLPQHFQKELGAGLASASGGSTQASTVLTHLLKVLRLWDVCETSLCISGAYCWLTLTCY